MMRVLMAVAAHKQSPMPDDAWYVPLRVGACQDQEPWQTADGRIYLRDDTGDNISSKNATYCELTGLYWLWTHCAGQEALGLCHYRRYFGGRRFGPKWHRLLTQRQAEAWLGQYDLILPRKRHYWIETNYSQYAHAHHEQDLVVTRQVLSELRDQRYTASFDRVMQRRSGHRFNMLFAKWDVFDAWCSWLFPVLAQVEKRLDTSGYSPKDQRVFGYLAERLLDVWLDVNPQKAKELPVVCTESQHWPRKILGFLRRFVHHGQIVSHQ